MDIVTALRIAATQYYGVDWIIALTVFAGIFLLGEKKKFGFLLGAASGFFGIIFSIQIQSLANGLMSVILLFVYLHGYYKWRQAPPVTAAQS